jgi:hypothetical protein
MCWKVAMFYTCDANTFRSSTFFILNLFIDWIWCARLVHRGFDIMHWGLHWCLFCISHWTLHWNATKLNNNFIHGLHERLSSTFDRSSYPQKTCFALTPLPLILKLIGYLTMTLAFGLTTLFTSCMSSQVCNILNTCFFPMNSNIVS